jgi:hypothetical protein
VNSGEKSLLTIAQAACVICQDSNSASRLTFAKAAVNRGLDMLWRGHEWKQLAAIDESGLRRAGSTVATFVSGEAEAPMPLYEGRLIRLILQTAGTPIVLVDPVELFERAGSSSASTGLPCMAAIIGTTAQYQRLAADSTLTLKSNSSSNDGVNTVRVYCRSSSSNFGDDAPEDYTGTFSSGVTSDSIQLAGYPISRVVLPVGWVGGFTIEDASGNVLVNIASVTKPGATATLTQERSFAVDLVRAWMVPGADYAATVIWQRAARPLLADADVPQIPVSTVLTHMAAAEIFLQMRNPQAAAAQMSMADRALSDVLRPATVRQRIQVRPAGGSILNQTGTEILWGGYW